MIEELKQLYIAAKENAADIDANYDRKFGAVKAQIDALEQEFQTSNAELIDLRTKTRDTLASVESQLRNAMIEWHQATGGKTYDDDLGVRVSKSYVYDNKDAVAWAETNAPVMIQKTIDKKTFESLPNIGDLEFVTPNDKITATISKSLGVTD